jgi:hypothetical protein
MVEADLPKALSTNSNDDDKTIATQTENKLPTLLRMSSRIPRVKATIKQHQNLLKKSFH